MALARHLMNALDNDHVELHELRGFVSADLAGALKEVQAISRGTKCSQFLFSLSLSPPELENVPIKTFEAAIEDIEKKIGLTGQPRAIVFHEKAGRRHAHCVWSRIDAGNMRAINLPHFKMKLNDIARELYLQNNWELPTGFKAKRDSDPLTYTQAEWQQAKRVKADPKILKALFKKCWESSDSRSAFEQAMLEQGLYLAKGDRRGFVAVDGNGEIYSISRWAVVKAKDVRARLGSSDDLPTVQQVIDKFNSVDSEDIDKAKEKEAEKYNAGLIALTRKRLDLAQRHRKERSRLSQYRKEAEYLFAQTVAASRPTGVKAAWLKVTGQYKKHEEEIVEKIALQKSHQAAQRQELIVLQLQERRLLQQEFRQLQYQHDITLQALRRENGEFLKHYQSAENNDGHRLAIDPNQPLVIPLDAEDKTIAQKVRRSPEYIFEVITDKKEDFTKSDIVRSLSKYISDPAALCVAIDTVMQSSELVENMSSPTVRFTTRDFRKVKSKLHANVTELAQSGHHAVKNRFIEQAIADQNVHLQNTVGAALSDEQVAAIEHVLGSSQIACVIGYAGAGKSTMLAAANVAWQRQGVRVVGAALAGKAAEGLEKSSGIESRTLASLEYSWKHGYTDLNAGDVLVIDEAGMIGTRQLARIVDHVKQRNAKLVLVGDPEQLQPIQAGRPFKEIAERNDAVALTEIRRQKAQWQRSASIALAGQDTSSALQAYDAHGFIESTDSLETAMSALVKDYIQDLNKSGHAVSRLALAHRRKDVHHLNQMIRAARKESGELFSEKLFNTDHGPRAFAKGDRVLLTRNDREIGVRNGMLGRVDEIAGDQLTILIDSVDKKTRRRITISPKSYGALDHGYATTIHKSQGATVDRAYVLGSVTMDRHLTYVAMTRHKEDLKLYLDQKASRKIYPREEFDLVKNYHRKQDTNILRR